MPKPMWRDSSCRMYWQIWRRSGSFELSASIRNRATAKVSATSCSPMVLIVQRALAEHRVEQLLLEARQRVAEAAQPLLDVAGEHFGVARLVHHLGGLEQLGVAAAHALHELAAHQHGAVLAVEQHAQPPVGEAPVELGALLAGEAVPVRRVVDVDAGRRPARRRRDRTAGSSRCPWRRSTGPAWRSRTGGGGPGRRSDSRARTASRAGWRCCAAGSWRLRYRVGPG